MPDRVDKKICSPVGAFRFLKRCKEPRLRDWFTAMQIAFGNFQNMTALERGLPSSIAADDERVFLQENGRDVRRTNLMHGLFDNTTDRMMLEWKFENSVDLVWFKMRVIQDCTFWALLAHSHRRIATGINFPARTTPGLRNSIEAWMILGLIALQVKDSLGVAPSGQGINRAL